MSYFLFTKLHKSNRRNVPEIREIFKKVAWTKSYFHVLPARICCEDSIGYPAPKIFCNALWYWRPGEWKQEVGDKLLQTEIDIWLIWMIEKYKQNW